MKMFIRLRRWFRYQCLVCGRSLLFQGCRTKGGEPHLRYCSMECAAYDGALKDFSKSWIMFGTLISPKRHHEYLEHDETDSEDSGAQASGPTQRDGVSCLRSDAPPSNG